MLALLSAQSPVGHIIDQTTETTVQRTLCCRIVFSKHTPGFGGEGLREESCWTVGEIENFGNHGVTANVSTFTAIANSVVQKFKGSKNYGTMNLVIGNMPSDAGQDIIETAAESTARYSVKITYPLRAGESTGEIHYLDVLVSKREFQDGAVDDVRKIAVDFEVCRAPVIVAAT